MGKITVRSRMGLCIVCFDSDDDGKDDTIMNMSELTGKYWYYNAWIGG